MCGEILSSGAVRSSQQQEKPQQDHRLIQVATIEAVIAIRVFVQEEEDQSQEQKLLKANSVSEGEVGSME